MSELTRLPQWRPTPAIARYHLPDRLPDWIFTSGSLTQRLKRHFPAVRVKVLYMQSARPRLDEARMLGLRPGQWVMLRVIVLTSADRPMILARSVTPMGDYLGSWRRLKKLGQRPLGDLLFTLPGLQRGRLQIARVNADFAGIQLPGNIHFSSPLWARRCLYRRHGRPLLVAEVFLPELYQ